MAHVPLLSHARRFAAAVSGYDVFYLASASVLEATLLTTDTRMARTATEQFGLPVTTVPTTGR